ncbi:NAD-dependent epimerase/dehydratase family protein [Secundilactobacillus kimchicus]|uniref:NAD-dependent epimerase/dehydratase family protein n=1 Tax=Secundilactobacillus kimchicus TaxID=528209 RepID=UPI0030B88A58
MNKTIVVTGGSGFVAGWVIREFLAHGYHVRTSLRHLNKAAAIRQSVTNGLSDSQRANLSFFEADLTAQSGWANGMDGADGVIHVASPLGTGRETTDELVKVAKDGTLNVLRAAKMAGITRVVMTSSQAASTPPTSIGAAVLDESYWTSLDNPELDPYRISKVESERAAWAFAEAQGLALTTILPGAIFGPVLSTHSISSNGILVNFLHRTNVVPKVPLEISDVRDLARLHRLAFENPVAIGKRYLAADQTITMIQVAKLYQQAFPERHLHLMTIPNGGLRFAAKFIPGLRSLLPMLKRTYHHTTAAVQNDLGWQQYTPEETVIDAAQSLIDQGIV